MWTPLNSILRGFLFIWGILDEGPTKVFNQMIMLFQKEANILRARNGHTEEETETHIYFLREQFDEWQNQLDQCPNPKHLNIQCGHSHDIPNSIALHSYSLEDQTQRVVCYQFGVQIDLLLDWLLGGRD